MQTGELDGLYHEAVLNHHHHPRNLQAIADAHLKARGSNPFCGDEVVLQVKLDHHGMIDATGHQGRGCIISQASASMLTEIVKGKTLDEVERISRSFRRLMQGELLSAKERETLGELVALEDVRSFPIRIKCALLTWSALEEGIKAYRRQGGRPTQQTRQNGIGKLSSPG